MLSSQAVTGSRRDMNSLFYIVFGRVEFQLRAAPGAVIVSSAVMQSDCLDEIDMEWLVANTTEVATNYFGKGEVITYNSGERNPAAGNQDDFIKYTVDWTSGGNKRPKYLPLSRSGTRSQQTISIRTYIPPASMP
jgi:hypothetical protein